MSRLIDTRFKCARGGDDCAPRKGSLSVRRCIRKACQCTLAHAGDVVKGARVAVPERVQHRRGPLRSPSGVSVHAAEPIAERVIEPLVVIVERGAVHGRHGEDVQATAVNTTTCTSSGIYHYLMK